MQLKRFLSCLCALAIAPRSHRRPRRPGADGRRTGTASRPVSDLQIAPDGAAVAYLVTRYDKEADESRSALWMRGLGEDESVQLTRGESVSRAALQPRRALPEFPRARGPPRPATQLWLLDRRGGEAAPVSHVTGEITDYEWSPGWCARGAGDARRRRRRGKSASKSPKPDRHRCASTSSRTRTAISPPTSRTHLYLLDVESGELRGAHRRGGPRRIPRRRSPRTGAQIAFVGNRIGSAAEVGRDDIDLMGPRAGATPRRLLVDLRHPITRISLWSPDGTQLAFLQGDAPKYNAYITGSRWPWRRCARHGAHAHRRARSRGLLAAVRRRRPLDPVRGGG